jgi:GTPase Era involved in 16S rRNA processing|tara:strand:+ start:623 stop:826 length:204 start_codon:yes stop_codon:yes gene_type:complete
MSKTSEWARAEKEREEEIYLEKIEKPQDNFTAIKLIDAIKNTDVIKQFNKSYKEKFGKPSIFDDGGK